LSGRKVGIVLSGANLDFRRLGSIARKAGDPAGRQAFYQIRLKERKGAMLGLFKTIKPLGLNISHLMVGQYDAELAFPIIGFDGLANKFLELEELLTNSDYKFKDISSRPDLPFRVAPFQPGLFKLPFAAILNFPERPGALTELLERISQLSNISYFNYVHTGEQVGRALAVFSFDNEKNRTQFLEILNTHGPEFTALARDTTQALGLEDITGHLPSSENYNEEPWADIS
jgi:threonine dehydratase